MGTIDPRDAVPLTDEGKRLQEEYRQRMKETLAEIPTFDAEQMRKDVVRIHADAIHQMGGDPVQRSYVDALTERLAAAEQRATESEATLATIGGADKATLARKLRRANAATRDAEQRAERAEAAAAMLRKALEDIAHDDWTYDTTKARAALTIPATQSDERAAAERATDDAAGVAFAACEALVLDGDIAEARGRAARALLRRREATDGAAKEGA